MYVMVCTRSDIAQAEGVICRYMSNSRRALERCEVDLEISEGQFRYGIVLWRHERSATRIC